MIELAEKLIAENLKTKNPNLDLSDCKITGYEKELDWLQEYKHLKALDLSSNDDTMRNTDFSLRKLTFLEKLNLESAYHPDLNFDLSFLKDLKQLTYLNVSDNNMYDAQFSELVALSQLEEIHLWGNDIQDISFLKNNRHLKTINLTMNWVTDISILSNFSKVEVIHLAENSIRDISPLSTLKNLKELYLGENEIQDIAALQNLTQLQKLFLAFNQVEDITVLQNLHQLEYLSLSANRIKDIYPLQNLKNLQTLEINDNPIQNKATLKYFEDIPDLFQ